MLNDHWCLAYNTSEVGSLVICVLMFCVIIVVVASTIMFTEVQYGHCFTDQGTRVFVILIHCYDLLERKTERGYICVNWKGEIKKKSSLSTTYVGKYLGSTFSRSKYNLGINDEITNCVLCCLNVKLNAMFLKYLCVIVERWTRTESARLHEIWVALPPGGGGPEAEETEHPGPPEEVQGDADQVSCVHNYTSRSSISCIWEQTCTKSWCGAYWIKQQSAGKGVLRVFLQEIKILNPVCVQTLTNSLQII